MMKIIKSLYQLVVDNHWIIHFVNNLDLNHINQLNHQKSKYHNIIDYKYNMNH